MDRLNPRQQKFAELIVAGSTAKAAYFASFPRCRSDKTAETEGCKLLKIPKVRDFIDALRKEVGEKAKSNLIADRLEILEFLTKIIRTAPGNINEKDPLCQSYKLTESVSEIKLPDKLRAAERLCKILGFDAPEEIKVSGDPITELMTNIRKKRDDSRGAE